VSIKCGSWLKVFSLSLFMRAWLVGPGLERPSRAPRRREEVGRVDG